MGFKILRTGSLFVSNSLTTVSVLGFKVLRTGSKLGCSLKKKKKKGLHFDFVSNFSVFLPKLECSLKKKITQNRSLHSEQTSAAD